MPKKTRKEKRLAQIHQKYRILQLETPVKYAENKPLKVNRTVLAPSPENISTVKYFYADLKKSLLLILVIITLEFSLYFASMFTYFKFF